MVDMIIVGAGFAGAVVANRAAEAGKKVLKFFVQNANVLIFCDRPFFP